MTTTNRISRTDPLKGDPTRTATLRRRFESKLRGRFKRLSAEIRKLLVTEDALGLRPKNQGVFNETTNVSDGQSIRIGTSASTLESSPPATDSIRPPITNGTTGSNERGSDGGNGVGGERIQRLQRDVVLNTRWKDLPIDVRIQRFRNWLNEKIERILIGDRSNPWTQEFTDAAYRKGVDRAFNDVRKPALQNPDLFQGSKQEFMRQFFPTKITRNQSRKELTTNVIGAAFSQAVIAAQIALLQQQLFTGLEGISATMSTQIQNILIAGVQAGLNPADIAVQLAANIEGISLNRAIVLARTEITRVHAEAQLTALENLGVVEVGVQVEWSTAGDDRVCTQCSPMDGTIRSVADARGVIPLHPQCLLPGNAIQGQVVAALKAEYSGQAFEILMRSGVKFTVTANHPILTEAGFVAACELNELDYLLGYFPQVESVANEHEQNQPVLIEDVFESVSLVGLRKVSSVLNLHGDERSITSKIDVVFADPMFREVIASEFEGIDDFVLANSGNGRVGSTDLSKFLLGSHSPPLGTFGGTLVSDGDLMLDQPSPNCTTADSVVVRQGVFGFTGNVPLAQRFLVNRKSMPYVSRFGLGAELDVLFSQPTSDGVTFNPKFSSELRERFPAAVSIDQIVGIRDFHYSGPVYDVETVHGYFTVSQGSAASIITGNCRCAWLPHVP